MRIGELAKAASMPEKTIRYYESRGLILSPPREENGYRRYGQHDLDDLIFIRRCRELGISLNDIRQLLEVRSQRGSTCVSVDKIIGRQLERVRSALRELQALEATLNDLKGCNGETVDNCRILKKLGK